MKQQDILKIVKQETKRLESTMQWNDEDDQLTLKITNKEIKEALRVDPDTKSMIDTFKDEYKAKLREIRKYETIDAESFKVVFDDKIDADKKQLFINAWNKHFASRITKHQKDHTRLKKRLYLYVIAGILTLLIYTAIQVCAIKFNDVAPSMKYVAVCFEGLLIVAWVFLWNAFEILIDDLPTSKTKMVDLYLMYKANGELSKTVEPKSSTTIKIELPVDPKGKINPDQIKTQIKEVKKPAK